MSTEIKEKRNEKNQEPTTRNTRALVGFWNGRWVPSGLASGRLKCPSCRAERGNAGQPAGRQALTARHGACFYFLSFILEEEGSKNATKMHIYIFKKKANIPSILSGGRAIAQCWSRIQTRAGESICGAVGAISRPRKEHGKAVLSPAADQQWHSWVGGPLAHTS